VLSRKNCTNDSIASGLSLFLQLCHRRPHFLARYTDVSRCGLDVGMAHQFLNHGQIHACLIQARGKGGPEHVGINAAGDPGPFGVEPHFIPDGAGMQGLADTGEKEHRGRGRPGEVGPDGGEVVLQLLGPGIRQGDGPVLVILGVADEEELDLCQ